MSFFEVLSITIVQFIRSFFYFMKISFVYLACICTCLIKHGVHLLISFNFENVEKSYTVFPLGHCTETVLRDPLSYATFSLRSLEGSHMTVSTVFKKCKEISLDRGARNIIHYLLFDPVWFIIILGGVLYWNSFCDWLLNWIFLKQLFMT